MKVVSNSFCVDYHYMVDENILAAKVTGRYDLADPQTVEFIKISINKLNEHNCSKCLVDHRVGEYIGNTFFVYDRPRLLGSLGLKRSVRIAGVFKDISKQIHFLETVLRNRGWGLRVFTDYNEAMTWLKQCET
jgi:hypothetical protein